MLQNKFVLKYVVVTLDFWLIKKWISLRDYPNSNDYSCTVYIQSNPTFWVSEQKYWLIFPYDPTWSPDVVAILDFQSINFFLDGQMRNIPT